MRSRYFLVLYFFCSAALSEPLCTTGELFAGAADFGDPMQRAVEGQGLRDTPPLGWRTLLFVGDKLVTTVGQEVWYTDLGSDKPVLKRVAGFENRAGRSAMAGPCSVARFANIRGIAAMSDGTLVGIDQAANDVFAIRNPFGADCAVSKIAGATAPQPMIDPSHPPDIGDVDGPRAQARLKQPSWLTVLGDVAYFIDDNMKVKVVSNDATHTIRTLTTLPDGIYSALIGLKGRLYAVGNNRASEGFIVEIDATSGSTREVLRGRAETWHSSGSINLSGLATDGTGLLTTQSGLLLYVSLDGRVSPIAGDGSYIEFHSDYDPRQPHPASELQLWATQRVPTAGSDVFLAYKDGGIYVSAKGVSPYVERILCK
jgi:hypothetical protein